MMQQKVYNWSSYRRKLVNIEKSISNDEVYLLLCKHYKELHSKLVTNKRYEDLFNDTYLKLTYNYKSGEDFIERFQYYFNMLKGAYYRDNKVSNYLLVLVDTYTDNILYNPDSFELELPEKKVTISIDELKADLLNYANAEKTSKKRSKKSK